MARWESESVEPCSCRTLADRGLLQPEGYMRTVLSLRRPLLDQGTVEQRVTARLARQELFGRRPVPLSGFVPKEVVLNYPPG
ncbi:Scr1 family TA system antitoxin-like transcriptional regulator [Streptomyces prasinus]|uniref:Scr1 family TA system antitoxin-like transcriptional regulator n=1 Tax=Streptomyces prasinus TaxID=67345 RepID=UPI0033C29C63